VNLKADIYQLGSSVFLRFKGADSVKAFWKSLVEESGMLFLPSTIYSSDLGETPKDRLWLGFGCSHLDGGIAALNARLSRNAK